MKFVRQPVSIIGAALVVIAAMLMVSGDHWITSTVRTQ